MPLKARSAQQREATTEKGDNGESIFVVVLMLQVLCVSCGKTGEPYKMGVVQAQTGMTRPSDGRRAGIKPPLTTSTKTAA